MARRILQKSGLWRTRRVVVVAPSLPQILDIVGPLQVFARARELLNAQHPGMAPAYRTQIVSSGSDRSILTNSGMRLTSDATLPQLRGGIDTLMVAGGDGIESMAANDPLVRFLVRRASTTRRVCSICTGAFALAKAGLLDGRRATTHWKYCSELARLFPTVDVDSHPIFIGDGHLYTSAGVTAGMDLALALVEEDFGGALALEVARELVLYLRRQGSQAQFSVPLAMQTGGRVSLRDLQMWMLENLNNRLSVDVLAKRVVMSPRHFARVFRTEMGMTPGAFVEGMRIEAARRRLEESKRSVEQIASDCGFGTADSMRRIFRRRLRVAPAAYRARFTQGQERL
jgi:transcriptional regulator GlxA family with amidase domain